VLVLFQVTPALAKLLLHTLHWSVSDIILLYEGDSHGTLVAARVKPANNNVPKPLIQTSTSVGTIECPVCYGNQPSDSYKSLACAHPFCKECWISHFEIQISEGTSTGEGNTLIMSVK